jgi:hypothetical protein
MATPMFETVVGVRVESLMPVLLGEVALLGQQPRPGERAKIIGAVPDRLAALLLADG